MKSLSKIIKLVKFGAIIIWTLVHGTITWLAGEAVYWIVCWCTGKKDDEDQ